MSCNGLSIINLVPILIYPPFLSIDPAISLHRCEAKVSTSNVIHSLCPACDGDLEYITERYNDMTLASSPLRCEAVDINGRRAWLYGL